MEKASLFVASSLLLAVSLALPLAAAAQPGAIDQTYVQDYRDLIIWMINSVLVPVLVAIAFIVFLWGVYKYFIYGADNEADRAKGKQFVMWGIIGFVVILSVWGLVAMVANTFGLESGGGSPTPPTFDTSGTSNMVQGTVSSWIVQP